MVTRRKFVGMLAGMTALTALAGSSLRLPRREDIAVDINPYLTDPKTAWFIKTEDEAGLRYFERHSNTLRPSAELNEEMLEDILNQIHDNQAFTTGPLYLKPRKLIVPPRLAARAHYVLTHRPTLFERFCWWLTSPELV